MQKNGFNESCIEDKASLGMNHNHSIVLYIFCLSFYKNPNV